MLTAQKIVDHSLECVWTLKGEKLTCTWVEKPGPTPLSGRQSEREPDEKRKVA